MPRHALSTLALALTAGPLLAGGRPLLDPARLARIQGQEGSRASAALQGLRDQRGARGLDADADFRLQQAETDRFGETHVHVQQLYRGLPVWGGAAVLHLDAEGLPLEPSDRLVPGLSLSVEPVIGASEALAIAREDMRPRGALFIAPGAELVVVPRIQRSLRPGLAGAPSADDVVERVAGGDLAWHLHLESRGEDELRALDYLVDAVQGRILQRWSSLETEAATGTGNTQYSGTVSLSTNSTGSGYELRDTVRGGTSVADLANHVDPASGFDRGAIYTGAADTWGDGANFYDDGASGPSSGPAGSTAAADALYGYMSTWDYYLNVHHRTGIDGKGTASLLRMHYGQDFDNAFWSDQCFCMTFGDGSAKRAGGGGFRNLTSVDVIGHELSHGVTSHSVPGGLRYYGESGGLNEGSSDVNGTFVIHYAYNGGTGAAVPDSIPPDKLRGYIPWTIGPQWSTPPLRYMYKPSLDHVSADAWFFDLGTLDPHLASGPLNRAIYFLAQGASTTGDTSSSYLPGGMAGLGNDKASAIWYRTLTTYLTSAATYHDARIGAERAARDLYGAGSPELAAVQNAFHAINVGPVAGQPDDSQAPAGVSVSESGSSGIISLGATATDNVGVAGIVFSTESGTLAETYAPGTLAFDSHRIPNGPHSLVATAYDAYGNHTNSAPLAFSTLNTYYELLASTGFEQGGLGWIVGGSASVPNDPAHAHSGQNYALLPPGGSYVAQFVQVPPGFKHLSLSFWIRVSSTSTSPSSTDWLDVFATNATFTQDLAAITSFSNLDATGTGADDSKWVKVGPFDMSAYANTGIYVLLQTSMSENATTFRVDDLSLEESYVVPDQNADGSVDGVDLGLLAQAYGTPGPLADLNGDGVVNDADATLLLDAFSH